MPLETVGEHEKISILGNLGVDVNALASWDFQPGLLPGMIKRFRESSHMMDKELQIIIACAERRFLFAGEVV